MSKTYQDSIKQKSREKLREFIARNLLTFMNPKDVKVVCFPGAEVEGEEAIEIKEIYDPLGIPRKNIIGLEAEAERAERLKKADLGIIVEQKMDRDFFRETETQFEVISLDYTGQQTDDRLKAIEVLVGKHLLSRYSVLCTNFVAQRESDSMKKRLFHKNSRYEIDSNGQIVNKEGDDSRIDLLENMLKEKTPVDLCEARNAFTTELIRILKLGKRNLKGLNTLNCLPYAQQIITQVKEGLQALRQSNEKGYEKRKHLLCEAGIFTPEEFELLNSNPPVESNIIRINLLKGLSAYLREYVKLNEGLKISIEASDSLARLLESQENRPYFPKTIERYSYNSNKNTMMFMDLFYLDNLEIQYQRMKDVFSAETDPFSIRWNPLHDTPKKVFRILSKIEDMFVHADKLSVPERIYLGSSWQPPRRKEKIKKEEAIDLLMIGCSPVEISECYVGFSKMQLAALKAHYVTMGKEIN